MKLFQQRTTVTEFETPKEFIEAFQVGKGDLIFASKTIYNRYFADLDIQADVAFHTDYGKGEPTDEMIDKMLADFGPKNYKRIIAIGGGSVIDTAKLLVIKDAKNTLELFEKRIPMVKDKQLVVIPTTCGSGSEVSSVSITEIKAKNTKMGLQVDALFPDDAVLIPQLLEELPFKVFVPTAIDALIHAIESFVSPKSNRYTELFSVPAIEIILKGFMAILEKGEDYRKEIIGDFLTASNYAGIAFANTGTGAVHATSYPLSGEYHVTHGEANYQMFVEVFKTYNRIQPEGKLSRVNKIMADIMGCPVDQVYEELTKVLDKLMIRQPLHKYGMKEEEIEIFTDSVIASQQRLLGNSYVPLSRDDIIQIYRNLY